MAPPRLSLTIAAKGKVAHLETLAAYAAAGLLEEGRGLDVHIAHDLPWAAAACPAHVSLHHCPPPCSIFQLWGSAVAAARAPYVAVLDIHCPPAPGWLERVLEEIERGTPLFFGPVEPGPDYAAPALIGYLLEYAQFNRPLAAALAEVPGNNLVCRRALLPAAGSLAERGLVKTFLIWGLEREERRRALPVDEMPVRYQKPFALRTYLPRRLRHGRCFAAWRHEHPGQPPRLACLAFTPLLPLLRLLRAGRWARHDQALWGAFWRRLHLLLLAEGAWSLGEALGYALGPGAACRNLD